MSRVEALERLRQLAQNTPTFLSPDVQQLISLVTFISSSGDAGENTNNFITSDEDFFDVSYISSFLPLDNGNLCDCWSLLHWIKYTHGRFSFLFRWEQLQASISEKQQRLVLWRNPKDIPTPFCHSCKDEEPYQQQWKDQERTWMDCLDASIRHTAATMLSPANISGWGGAGLAWGSALVDRSSGKGLGKCTAVNMIDWLDVAMSAALYELNVLPLLFFLTSYSALFRPASLAR